MLNLLICSDNAPSISHCKLTEHGSILSHASFTIHGTPMTDSHQIYSIISTAIVSCKRETEDDIDVEKAKHMAKCIVAALTDAGLDIVLKDSKE